MKRYITKCKDYDYLTYAVYDKKTRDYVDGTETTVLAECEEWCRQLNDEHECRLLDLRL